MCAANRFRVGVCTLLGSSEEVDFAVGLLERLDYAEGLDAATPGDDLIAARAGRMPKRDGGAWGGGHNAVDSQPQIVNYYIDSYKCQCDNC